MVTTIFGYLFVQKNSIRPTLLGTLGLLCPRLVLCPAMVVAGSSFLLGSSVLQLPYIVLWSVLGVRLVTVSGQVSLDWNPCRHQPPSHDCFPL